MILLSFWPRNKKELIDYTHDKEFKKCKTTTCPKLRLPVRWAGAMPEVEDAVQVQGQVEESDGKLVFLAQSLVKRNELFIYRYHELDGGSAWVVFYNPILIRNKLPRRLDEKLIKKLGRELARFHKACTNVSNQLPQSSKNVIIDIQQLKKSIYHDEIKMCDAHKDTILRHADYFLRNTDRVDYMTEIETIPVFVDWNIGNFSVSGDGKFYSRWDYDWFRMSSRVMDFYFFSRVVSDMITNGWP